jgi:hypothetical protein
MSRKQASFDMSKVHAPPGGQPFCWISRELMESPAWRARSLHCMRLIEFLQHEHMSHAGKENGGLVAPYAQLERWGISRRYIKDAIAEAEGLKLVQALRGGLRAHTKAAMTRFRLTFYHTREAGNGLQDYWAAAGDEWCTVTVEDAKRIIALRPARNPEKKNADTPGGTGTGTGVTVEPAPVPTVEPVPKGVPQKSAIFADARVVPPLALLSIYISGGRGLRRRGAHAGVGGCAGGSTRWSVRRVHRPSLPSSSTREGLKKIGASKIEKNRRR